MFFRIFKIAFNFTYFSMLILYLSTFSIAEIPEPAKLSIESIEFSEGNNNWLKWITIKENQAFKIRVIVKNDSETDAGKVYVYLLSSNGDKLTSDLRDIIKGENAHFEFDHTISNSIDSKKIGFIAIAKSTDTNIISEVFVSEFLTILDSVQFIYAKYEDENKNEKVDEGDEITLSFDEDIKNNFSIEDFILFPPNTFGKEPSISNPTDKDIIIKLGENPVLTGIRKIIIKEDLFDIIFNDDLPPKIISVNGKTKDMDMSFVTSQKPIIFMLVKEYPIGFNNGIDPKTGIKIFAENQPKKFDFELFPNNDPDILILKLILNEPLSEGENEITIKVSDRKEIGQNIKLTFMVVKSSDIGEAEIISNSFVTYPNPALPGDTIFIRYSLTKDSGDAIINIYDVAGQLVKRFNKKAEMDVNKIEWDGTTDKGDRLSPGVYICELNIGKQRAYWRLAIRPGLRMKQ